MKFFTVILFVLVASLSKLYKQEQGMPTLVLIVLFLMSVKISDLNF